MLVHRDGPGEPFAVVGLYRQWEEDDGTRSHSFTQLTINADDHPFMKRFHRQGEKKRSLVIVPASGYDEWLGCKDREHARTYLQPYPGQTDGRTAGAENCSGQADRTVLNW